ncbi:MAG: hypothetical protein AABX85_04185 [Nanoarchaeota archaeon]
MVEKADYKMKKTNLIIGIFVLIFLAVLVSADVNQLQRGFYSSISDNGTAVRTTNPVNDFNVIGFVCANEDCSIVNGTLWNGNVLNSGSNNELTLTYPEVLLQKGYGLFFYKEGYIPYEYRADWRGNGQADNNNVFLSKKENCQVPINDLMISHYGDKILVNATLSSDVSSAVSHAGPLNYVPDSIAHLYSIDADVTFKLNGPENAEMSDNVNLPFSEHKRVYAEFGIIKAGQYNISVTSNANDVKCVNSIPLTVYSNLLIEDNRTNVTLPTISILSPEAKTYNTRNILVNLRSTNATSVFYNWIGVNVSYTSPQYVTFNEGSNTLTAYAVNDVTTAHTSVTFNVDTSQNNQTNNQTNGSDTTPPASVTNLHLISRGTSYLNWGWTNPSDSDFSQAIIYINGINVLNTSNNYYNAINLQPNSTYTITIRTKDLTGNVNTTLVSNTATTLSLPSNCTTNCNNVTEPDEKKSDGDKKSKRLVLEPYEENESIAGPIFLEENVISLEKSKQKVFDWSLVILILFVLGSILLLILIIILLMGRR